MSYALSKIAGRALLALGAVVTLAMCGQPPRQPPPVAQAPVIGTAPSLPPANPPPPRYPPPEPGTPLAGRADVQAFIREMAARHDFDPNDLSALFRRVRSQPDIIALMNRPAEAKPWYAYREIFLTPQRIQGGAQFWDRNAAALARAERTYGVPAEVIVAIIGVETSYGGNTGKHRVIDALATLAFDFPRRAEYFRKELENFLLLARDEGVDPLSLKGSYAGAMGLAQFMPSSYRSYAVDFNGDRRRDLWTNPADAIGSVANYLSKHRWQPGEPIATPARVDGGWDLASKKPQKPTRSVASLRRQGVVPQGRVDDGQSAFLLELAGSDSPEYWLGFDNFYVITRYNTSALYAMAVYQLSRAIREQRTTG